LWKVDNNTTTDPLVTAIMANKGSFGFINHTYDHPNIDCSSASFITKEINDNIAWANAHGLTIDPSEVVTGEHSGLANSRPGNPGTIDPPSIDDVVETTGPSSTTPASTTTPATTGVPSGTYDYALTAKSPAGESTASVLPGNVVGATGTVGNSAVVTFNAVCHAVTYNLYRSTAGTNTWSLVGTQNRSATALTDDGTAPLVLSFTDNKPSGTAGTLPTANGAALAPYSQNPNYVNGLLNAGIRSVATDASKTYPTDPLNVAGTQWLLGQTFTESGGSGSFQAVPRYPSNVYYNTSRQGQQLDEYNWIYVAPGNGGGCVPIANVTTCRTTAATWADYLNSENTIMFRHLMGNDPRPHFMHQSNLADYNPALPETDPGQGGILYPVVDGLLSRYDSTMDRTKAPLVQLTSTQIAATLSQQDAWAAALAAGKVTAWLQDGQLHVKNAGTTAIDVPLTGTTVGDQYGGQKSGWATLAAGAEQVFNPNDPANAGAPTVTGTARVGETLTAHNGSWTGTPAIDFGYQWQRCNGAGASCANITGATGATYALDDPDHSATIRVVVSGGNWISSISQARSATTGVVAARPVPPASAGSGRGSPGASAQGSKGSKATPLLLTKITMSPKRFAVSHRKRPQGTKLDGSRITWKLNKAAKVRLTFQRQVGSKKHRRWVTVGTIARTAKKGTGVVRFTGRFGSKPMAPRAYRLTITASTKTQKAGPKRVAFTVVRG
jgi:hypothetical protein